MRMPLRNVDISRYRSVRIDIAECSSTSQAALANVGCFVDVRLQVATSANV